MTTSTGMSHTLQAAPSSGAQRGETTIQPAYFTSSLFVDALRADVRELARLFSKHFCAQSEGTDSTSPKPFELFKILWSRLGWQWLHLKVLEPRARETFINVVLRVFLECTESTESTMQRAVGVFGLYTFYMSQPSTSVPRQIYRTNGIPIELDRLKQLLDFPDSLIGPEKALKPYIQFTLQTLLPRFLILPPSDFQAQNPRNLPREEVRTEDEIAETSSNDTGNKKSGRPSKAEKAQKKRAGVAGLDRWLAKYSYPTEAVPAITDPAGGAGRWRPDEQAEADEAVIAAASEPTTHVTLSQRPLSSLDTYRVKKKKAVNLLEGKGHAGAIERAGSRVFHRLKEIDAAAAEQGLEVGSEGGELSAIGRVESAVHDRQVLSLLEGGGLT